MKKIITVLLLLSTACLSPLFAGTAYFITIDGVITKTTSKFIKENIDFAAKDESAVLFVIKLNTPGGILDSTRNIVQDILDSPLPVAVYVSPGAAEAGSAGTFITLAADYAFMTDTSTIGAAHPVSVTGANIEGDMRSKTINSTESFMRSIAEKRGRNVDTAILTVTESKSLTSKEALNEKLIDAVVNSDDELISYFQKVTGYEKNITKFYIEAGGIDKLFFILSDPNTLVLLLMFGVLMIFLEIKAPGTFVFAGLGVLSLIIFLFGANIIPVNLIGVLLVLAGIILLIMELFFTSFGIFAAGGLICYVIGMRILFNTQASDGVNASIWLIAVTTLIVAGFILFVLRLVIRDFKKKSSLGLSGMNGKEGTVLTWENGHGQIRINSEIWNAKSTHNLKKGDTVKIVSIVNLTVDVVPLYKDDKSF